MTGRNLIGVLILWLFGMGCSDKPAERTGRLAPMKIVTTVGMVADIVQNVAGDRANVSHVIGSGVDPHLYKPTRGDVVQLLNADVVFYSGLMLEGKMGDALKSVAEKKSVFAVTERLDPSYLLEAQGLPGHFDPHVWMDVAGWIHAVSEVAEALSQIDPDRGSEYTQNSTAYQQQLVLLNDYAKTCIASIPKESRVMVTAHDAFNYFGRAYEIEVVGIQGISTESEAGLDDIRRLIDMIVERKVKAVFVETSVSDKNVKALIEGCQARGHTLTIGGSLFSDAMGEEGSYEGTYIGMIDHNVTVVTRALGGVAPEKGLNGRLSIAVH